MGALLTSLVALRVAAGGSASAKAPSPPDAATARRLIERPAVLVNLEPPLRALLDQYHPGVRFDRVADGLTFEHDTRTFQVPEYLKAGKPRKTIEVKGTIPCVAGSAEHGILGSIGVVPGRYVGQRLVLPGVSFQLSSETYFERLGGVVPSPSDTARLPPV